jgi:hypothetical protein
MMNAVFGLTIDTLTTLATGTIAVDYVPNSSAPNMKRKHTTSAETNLLHHGIGDTCVWIGQPHA